MRTPITDADIAQGMEESLTHSDVERRGHIYTLRTAHGRGEAFEPGLQGRVWRRGRDAKIFFALPEAVYMALSAKSIKPVPKGQLRLFRGRTSAPERWREHEYPGEIWYFEGLETPDEIASKCADFHHYSKRAIRPF